METNTTVNENQADIITKTKEANKKRMLIFAIVAVILIISVCIGFVFQSQAKYSLVLNEYNNLSESHSELESYYDFFDSFAVCINGDSVVYHKLNCSQFDPETPFAILNIDMAKTQGYQPCKLCIGEDDTDMNDTNSEGTIDLTNENGDFVRNDEVISQADYKAACKKVAYEDIARQPDKYIDQDVVFTGEVVQVDKISGNSYYARVNVTKDEYGFYDDTVYITFTLTDGSPKILEDDIVTFYGVCTGEASYTSVFGQQITIPSGDVAYIDI